MTTCLIVIGIIGIFCQVAPAPETAVCHTDGNSSQLCVVEADQLDIWASYYDPTLGGINCDGDCSTLGDGTAVTDELYGTVAACPMGWYGWHIETEFGSFHCRDHGGDVHPKYKPVYHYGRGFYDGWVIVVDFLLKSPEWWTFQTWDFQLR